jgi:hypothetical protein
VRRLHLAAGSPDESGEPSEPGMTDFRHFLLTRFNVRHDPWRADRAGRAVLTEEWLDHRFDLFERFCLPSVAAQTCRDFRWLVFFDPDTPPHARERVERCRSAFPFEAVFTTDSALIDEVRARAGATGTLVTTRLDNDDSLHREALARVQARLPVRELSLVNFREGYYAGPSRLVRVRHPCNMFISMLEPAGPEPFRTVWCREHGRLGELGPVHQIDDIPGWMARIHDRNLSNALPERAPDGRSALRRAASAVRRRLAWRRAAAAGPEFLPAERCLAELAPDFGLEAPVAASVGTAHG